LRLGKLIQLRSVGNSGFENAPDIDHISFAVADVDGIYARLREAGVAFDGEPQDQSWGARMVGLKDPDGDNLYLPQKLQFRAPVVRNL
jgi:catechol 2,3-dioxygenase-like lactoylglutathione lyase family enzyme